MICTLGPSSTKPEILEKLLKAGMNVARFNFSHGTHESHKKDMDLFRSVRDKLKMPAAILLDTKGPEIRFKNFKNGKITLKEGDNFTLTTEDILGDESAL